ncbi:MAG: acyl carrier protein [Nitrospirae bacterium]|nr:acyl carrier protein [Nitrospirota bacterium]
MVAAANTEQRVREIIAEQLGMDVDEVKIDSSIVDDLGADSLDIVEMMMSLEEEFGIEIPEDQAEKIKTVKDVTGYIKQHQSQ